MKLTAHWPNDLEMPKVVHNVQFTMTNVQSVLLIGQSVVEFIEVFRSMTNCRICRRIVMEHWPNANEKRCSTHVYRPQIIASEAGGTASSRWIWRASQPERHDRPGRFSGRLHQATDWQMVFAIWKSHSINYSHCGTEHSRTRARGAYRLRDATIHKCFHCCYSVIGNDRADFVKSWYAIRDIFVGVFLHVSTCTPLFCVPGMTRPIVLKCSVY